MINDKETYMSTISLDLGVSSDVRKGKFFLIVLNSTLFQNHLIPSRDLGTTSFAHYLIYVSPIHYVYSLIRLQYFAVSDF